MKNTINALRFLSFVIVFTFILNNYVAQANNRYLDVVFWNNIEDYQTISQFDFKGSNITVKHNIYSSSNHELATYINIAGLLSDNEINSLNPKIIFYIYNTDKKNVIEKHCIIFNQNKDIDTTANNLIDAYESNFYKYNDGYNLLSYFKSEHITNDTKISMFISLDNKRLQLINKSSISDFNHSIKPEKATNLNNSDISVNVNASGHINRPSNKKHNNKPEKHSTTKYSNNQHNSITKYYEDYNNANDTDINENGNYQESIQVSSNNQYNITGSNNSRMSNSTILLMIFGAILVTIGIMIIIFNCATDKKDKQ